MANGLPYFKFISSEWLTGNIVYESLELQGLFINICAVYWKNGGKLSVSEIEQRYKKKALIAKLTDRFFSVTDGFISIEFLDEQLSEREYIAKTNSENGRKGGRPAKFENKPTANRPISEPKAKKSNIEEEEDKEEELEKEKNKRESIAVNGSHAPKSFIFPDDLDEIKPDSPKQPEPQKKETASRRQKNDPVSLEDSRWGDRRVFDAECPKEWDQSKKDHYWLAMQNYSNRGNKLKDWIQAASNWERRDALDALNKKHPLPHVNLNGNQPYFEQPQYTDQINKLIYAFNELAKTNHDHKNPSVRNPISMRLAAGADPQDMLEIIQLKCLEWGTDKRQFLTLNALFSDKNYANFLQEVQDIKDKKRAPNLSTQQLGKIRHERIKAALGQDF